jgi:hypothetical protein
VTIDILNEGLGERRMIWLATQDLSTTSQYFILNRNNTLLTSRNHCFRNPRGTQPAIETMIFPR